MRSAARRDQTISGMRVLARRSREVPQVARVVLVGGDELTRAGLRKLLSSAPQLDIVGEASTGEEALALCLRLRPELVVLDIQLPQMDGLKAVSAIEASVPGTRILVITLDDGPGVVLDALRSGADGCVVKGTHRAEFLIAIRKVLLGCPYIDPAVADWILRVAVDTDRQVTSVLPERVLTKLRLAISTA
jgi:DNA-binding NarL/FixJ family response regulator